MPTFSVLVPTHNQQNYLKEALNSLLAQSEKAWEAIVVNDGSTDDTVEILRSYSMQDSRIIGINQENGGTASALNTALSKATGKWICWLSSDDLFEQNKLELHRQYINALPDIQFFFSDFTLFDDQGNQWNEDLSGIGLEIQEEHLTNLLGKSYISGISVCVNHALWKRTGFFQEHFRYAQDYDMWLRLLAAGKSYFIPERTCRSRTHPQQGSNVFNEACVYDSGKAAIQFLNQHPFQDLFPLINLDNETNAKKALDKALQIAALPNSLCYGIGVHPCLINRISEWIAQNSLPSKTKLALTRTMQMRLNEIMGMKDNHAFKFMWWNAVNALCQKTGQKYYPINPNLVAEASYARFNEASLKNYLFKFENLDLPEIFTSTKKQPENILLVWRKNNAGDLTTNLRSLLMNVLKQIQIAGCAIIFACDDHTILSNLQIPLSVYLSPSENVSKIAQTWNARVIELRKKDENFNKPLQNAEFSFPLSVETLQTRNQQQQFEDWLLNPVKARSGISKENVSKKISAITSRAIRIFKRVFSTNKYIKE